MQALPLKHRRLVDDSLAHWKPVQANKNQRDVVVAMSPGGQAGCRVLHRLESPKINMRDRGQKRVAVVQSNEGLDTCRVRHVSLRSSEIGEQTAADVAGKSLHGKQTKCV